MKILLVDDHLLFLDGLKALLNSQGYYDVLAAKSGHEAIEKAKNFRPDIILMDVYMPEVNGLEATRRIKEFLPESKIVMLTSAENDDSLFEAIKCGASGYLLKDLASEELFELLEGLVDGESLFSQEIAIKIMNEFACRKENSVQALAGLAPEIVLTSRQNEVLRLVAQGKTYKEAAALLGLTERTIKYHMGNILGILHVDSKAQAIYYAGTGAFDR